MAIQLNLDEMLEACLEADPGAGRRIQARLEAIGSEMAQLLAAKLDIECGIATFQGTGLAGTCAPFYQKYPAQPCPGILARLDDPEEWEPRLRIGHSSPDPAP